MYQFLVSTANTNYTTNVVMDLTDKDGNRTGHLLGLMMRTLAYHECGVKPIWVFDGKPPTMKGGEVTFFG
jgi:flap endonuclease-1